LEEKQKRERELE